MHFQDLVVQPGVFKGFMPCCRNTRSVTLVLFRCDLWLLADA